MPKTLHVGIEQMYGPGSIYVLRIISVSRDCEYHTVRHPVMLNCMLWRHGTIMIIHTVRVFRCGHFRYVVFFFNLNLTPPVFVSTG